MKDDNMKMYLMGQYVIFALSATVGNMFKKHGQKPNEYPKEPFDLFYEHTMHIHENMTEEEKKQETEKLFDMLAGMQKTFEASHK